MIMIVCRVRICIHANRSRQQTQPYFPLSLLISTEFERECRLSRTTCLSRSHGHGKFKRKPRKLINNTGLLCIRTYDNFLSTRLQKKPTVSFCMPPRRAQNVRNLAVDYHESHNLYSLKRNSFLTLNFGFYV